MKSYYKHLQTYFHKAWGKLLEGDRWQRSLVSNLITIYSSHADDQGCLVLERVSWKDVYEWYMETL